MKAISIHKAIITHHLKQKMVRDMHLTTNYFLFKMNHTNLLTLANTI